MKNDKSKMKKYLFNIEINILLLYNKFIVYHKKKGGQYIKGDFVIIRCA